MYKLLSIKLLSILVLVAFLSVGGCGSSGGGANTGCCFIGPDACIDGTNEGECDILQGELNKGVMCVDIPECGVVQGCCVIAENDCMDDQTQAECDGLGGMLEEGDSCAVVPACNVEPPPGEGCCVIAENDCVDDQTQAECDGLGGMLEEGDSCAVVPACNVGPALDGEMLYIDNCVSCHGPNGDGSGITGVPVAGASALEIEAAILTVPLMMSLDFLTAEEIDAIADFLAP